MQSPVSFRARIGTMNPIGQFHVAYATRICPSAFAGSWRAAFRFRACIGTMNPPLTPPRRGTDRARRDVCSAPGRDRGVGRSWKGELRRLPPLFGLRFPKWLFFLDQLLKFLPLLRRGRRRDVGLGVLDD